MSSAYPGFHPDETIECRVVIFGVHAWRHEIRIHWKTSHPSRSPHRRKPEMTVLSPDGAESLIGFLAELREGVSTGVMPAIAQRRLWEFPSRKKQGIGGVVLVDGDLMTFDLDCYYGIGEASRVSVSENPEVLDDLIDALNEAVALSAPHQFP